MKWFEFMLLHFIPKKSEDGVTYKTSQLVFWSHSILQWLSFVCQLQVNTMYNAGMMLTWLKNSRKKLETFNSHVSLLIKSFLSYFVSVNNLQVMDETLYKVAEKMKNFAAIYLVDVTEVPDFNKMYELYDPCTIMFFYRNKHIMIDLGTGNNNKINWAMEDEQEFIDIVETIFRGARKGRGLVVSPKDYSTKYRY